nr:diguanylate cyclase [Ardenticatena sp.]
MNLERDALTGAYRRDDLLPTLDYLLTHALTYAPCSLLFIDIDYFKSINDAFGHARGDDVLRFLGATLRHYIRESDFLFRYGGDELVLVLPNSTQQESLRLGQRLLGYFQTTLVPGAPPLRISLSMGVATAPDDATTAQDLLEIADARLHTAKTNGRAQIANAERGTRTLTPQRIPPPLADANRKQFHAFCQALTRQKRTTMRFLGSEAEARFLFRACVPLAKDENILWLSIEGAPARQHRLFGALAALTAPHPPPTTGSALADFLHAAARRSQAHAVGIFVFHADLLDPGTQSVLDVLHTFSMLPLGMVWHTVGPSYLPAETRMQLERLSNADIHAWLEMVLQASVDEAVSTFLEQKSKGMPLVLDQWARICLERHLLVFEKGSWRMLHPFSAFEPMRGIEKSLHVPKRATDIPPPPPLFVGREKEMHRLHRFFEGPGTLGVSGAPGSGKTTLIAQAAREGADLFEQVLFLRCTPTTTPDALWASLCAALGAPPSAALSTIQTIFAQTRLLLLIDSPPAEIEQHPSWRALLRHPGSSTIVVAATHLPNFAWDDEMDVQGLPVPREHITFEEWSREPTLWLLRSLIRQSNTEFDITPSNVAALVEICRFVDGMPQALDMIAASVAAFGRRFIQTWKEQVAHFPQKSALIASMHMYMLKPLAPREQEALQTLAVFPGAFNHESAHGVAGVSPFLLSAFEKAGLVQHAAPGLFEIKPLLRLTLWQQLQKSPAAWHHAQQMLIRFYVQQAPQRLHTMRTAASRTTLDWISAHLQTIEHVWALAIDAQDASTILALGELMHFYFDYCNAFARGRSFFAQALTLLPETALAQQAASLVHARYAIFCRRLGMYELSEARLHTALRLARQAGAHDEEAFCQNHLGYVYMRRGMYDEALQCLHAARHILAVHPNPHLLAMVYNTQGMVYESMQRYTQARWTLLRSLVLFCRQNDQRGIAFVLNNLGIVKEMCSEYNGAEACYRLSERLFANLGDRWGRQLPLLNLGDLALARNQMDVAYQAYGEAVRNMRRFMNMPRLYSLMNRIAFLLEAQGRIDEAMTLHLFIVSQPREVVNATDHSSSQQALQRLIQKHPDLQVDTTKSPVALRLEALYLLTTIFPPEQATL